MKIELLSIQKGSFSSELESAKYIHKILLDIADSPAYDVTISKREEVIEDIHRVKYDIIINGSIPQSLIDILTNILAFTHYTMDGIMHKTKSYSQSTKY